MGDEREQVVREERFVVEVSERVPAAEVVGVAGRIALHLHMDAARVLKLLDGRSGPVTKPVLRDKADIIADAFREAGVPVIVRHAEPTPAAPAGGVGEAAGSAADLGDPYRVGAAPTREGGAPSAGGGREERPARRYVGRTGAVPEHPPNDGSSGAEATPASAFLSSTRWVPSPHDDLGYGPDDLGREIADLPDAPLPPPRTSPLGQPARPPRRREDGPGLRSFLLVGLVVALVLLLVLQAVNRNRSLAPEGATVAMGLDAYRAGDFVAAGHIWRPLAEAGDATAQYMLGYMAQNGLGQPWSNRDAAVWYQRAADLGQPQAQLELGMLYLRGMGVERDAGRAATLLRAAAESGYGAAQYQYAMLLFQGEGTPRDFAAAARWFRAAGEGGVAEAQAYVEFLRPGGAAASEPPGAVGDGVEH